MKRILLALCCLVSGMSLFAYTHIPADSTVVKGVLPNGLTYYIRHNDFIPNRADFRIVQKVGSIQEKPEQRGLAHFLEHMAFNGTKHFPDKMLINYLETIGVQFGGNLNASTGVDKTIYEIMNVPTERVATVDSCLLILRDWSDGILLEGEAIDKERGVIEEEWRTRNNPVLRQMEENSSIIYGSDKYADCMPIGNMDVVRNCSYETLRDYYRAWYRPDLQGIIVVGDIDVQKTEEKIKELFASAKVPEGAPERVYYPVSDYDEPRIVVSSDSEMPYTLIWYYQKLEDFADSLKDTEENFRNDFVAYLVSDMLSSRLSDITKEEQPPFTNAYADSYPFLLSDKQKSFCVELQVSTAGAEVAFKRMMAEVERIRRFGFTETELERAKKSYLALVEQTYNHRNQHENVYYVYKYISNFLAGEAMPSLETEFELTKKISEEITLNEVNAWVNSWNKNNALIWFLGSDKKELPTEEFVKNELAELSKIELAPYEDVSLPESIIPEGNAPAGGKILKKKSLKNGAIEYKLSNGVEVFFKQTDFKDDEILLSAKSFGGLVMADSLNAISARVADEVYLLGGIGTMNKIQLDKFLSDKRTAINANIDEYTESLGGYASKKDIDYLFQLLYAHFTALKSDNAAYNSYVERFISECKDREKNPYTAIRDSIGEAVYGNHPLQRRFKAEDVQNIDYAKSLAFFKERFSNAADFKFTIVGSIDEATLESYLEKYVASLPVSGKREKVKRAEPMVITGNKSVRFNKQMNVPATVAYIHNFVKVNPSVDRLSYDILEAVLDLVYTEKVREEQGGTYGVGTYVGVQKLPTKYAEMVIQFSTDASKIDELLPIVYTEFANLAKQGPREADMQKVKEHIKKTYDEYLKDNNYWINRLQDFQLFGKDNGATYLKRLDKVSAKDIQKAAKALLNSPNLKEIVQVGVSK